MGFNESSLERLIVNLKKLRDETDVSGYLVEDVSGRYLESETILSMHNVPAALKKLVEEIMQDLSEWMIADNGYLHRPNREILYRHGFRFVKGREDLYGVIDAIICIPSPRNAGYAIIYKPKD